MSRTFSRPASRIVAFAASLGLVAIATAACGGGAAEDNPDSGEVPASVSLLLRNDVDSFDPFKSAAESGAKQAFDAVYDTLVRVNATKGTVEVSGSLAEKWEVEPDNAVFTLRDGLTCADGTELTAKGVAQSLQHIADPATGALYASRIFGPGGVKEIVADDAANTVTISLNDPYTYLLEGLSQGYIVCPTAFDNIEALATTPAETGPYQITELKRGEKYVLTSRETPAVDQATLPGTIELRVVNDDTTRANLVETQGADIASVLGRDAERLQRNKKAIDGRAFLSDAVLFNQADGHPGVDVEIRRAIAMAIDSTGYAKASTFDLGAPITTIYTPNMACYSEDNGKLTPDFDLAAAKSALDKAGFGPDGKKLTIRLLGIDSQNSGPEFLADSLRKAGIEVKLSKGTLEQAIGVLFGDGSWDVMVYPYPVPTPVPSTLVNQISGQLGATLNVGSVTNDVYNTSVAEAAALTGDKQCALWSKAEAALLENVDIKPVVWSNAAWFANDVTFDANYFNINTRTIRQSN